MGRDDALEEAGAESAGIGVMVMLLGLLAAVVFALALLQGGQG